MKLQSDFALLDVNAGRRALDRMCTSRHDLPTPIPVIIVGVITHRHGSCDGISQEFGIKVTGVEIDMAAAIKRAKLKTSPTGKTTVEPAKPRRSVSKAIGAEKSATRKAAAWTKAAKGKATVRRKA